MRHDASAAVRPISTARMYVNRADGTREVHYSLERIPLWQLRRKLKQLKHLRFMRAEDRKAGYAN